MESNLYFVISNAKVEYSIIESKFKILILLHNSTSFPQDVKKIHAIS